MHSCGKAALAPVGPGVTMSSHGSLIGEQRVPGGSQRQAGPLCPLTYRIKVGAGMLSPSWGLFSRGLNTVCLVHGQHYALRNLEWPGERLLQLMIPTCDTRDRQEPERSPCSLFYKCKNQEPCPQAQEWLAQQKAPESQAPRCSSNRSSPLKKNWHKTKEQKLRKELVSFA